MRWKDVSNSFPKVDLCWHLFGNAYLCSLFKIYIWYDPKIVMVLYDGLSWKTQHGSWGQAKYDFNEMKQDSTVMTIIKLRVLTELVLEIIIDNYSKVQTNEAKSYLTANSGEKAQWSI